MFWIVRIMPYSYNESMLQSMLYELAICEWRMAIFHLKK